MKLDLHRFFNSEVLPFETGEDEKDLIENGMSFDILTRIRKLFSFSSSPTNNSIQTTDPNLTNGTGPSSSGPPPLLLQKRKAAEKENSDFKVLRKYRKLDTEFPKVINVPFEDDTKTRHLKQKKRKTVKDNMPVYNQQQRSSGFKFFSWDPKFKKKQKKSDIVTIKTTFADQEFSDDEDLGLTTQNFKKPPPPLIEKKTGEILASSVIPNLKPIRKALSASTSNSSFVINRSKEQIPCRSDQFLKKQSLKTKNWGQILKENKSVSSSSSSRYPPSQKNSILNEEHQNNEKDDYLKLLQQIEPNLYKSKNDRFNSFVANRKSLSNTSNTTVDLTQSRKIPFIQSRNFSPNVITVEDEDSDGEVTEILVLDEDDEKLVAVFDKYKNDLITEPEVKKEKQSVAVEPVNSFQDKINLCPIIKEDNWVNNFREKYKHDELYKQIKEAEEETSRCSKKSTLAEFQTQEKLKNLHLFDPECIVIDDFYTPEDEVEPLPELDEEFINDCLSRRPHEVLISKFNQNITRNDINTLLGRNWLNDEIINFYMNLLMERGEQPDYPSVYSMNTFFVPRIMQSGHSGVKRWTKKVDIFSYDVIPIPVHVGGVHWCMAIIDMQNKTIKYYDSMGTPNNKILNALENYLKDESLDKKKQPFDTSEFSIENVADCPRQNNGSDCGVFSCMFAEYACRNNDITFTQENMEYFRRKMIQEICQGKLLL